MKIEMICSDCYQLIFDEDEEDSNNQDKEDSICGQ